VKQSKFHRKENPTKKCFPWRLSFFNKFGKHKLENII